jgi:hypothetical protein
VGGRARCANEQRRCERCLVAKLSMIADEKQGAELERAHKRVS